MPQSGLACIVPSPWHLAIGGADGVRKVSATGIAVPQSYEGSPGSEQLLLLGVFLPKFVRRAPQRVKKLVSEAKFFFANFQI